MANCKRFFDCYGTSFATDSRPRVIDIGAQDVNGSLREVTPAHFEYLGVDFVMAKGVDVVLTDPYVLPFADGEADVVVSSSCLEHSEMFWLLFLEVLRILKPRGLLYLNVPSNGVFHRYPVDCWRFYPDSGVALVAWAKRNGFDAALLESYTSHQSGAGWNDCVAVFLKDSVYAPEFRHRIVDDFRDFDNGRVFGSDEVLNFSKKNEDQRKLAAVPKLFRPRSS
jgi:SAM-dependent methyltransferase